MEIINWMIEKGYAKHPKHAGNIIAGLHLNELYEAANYELIKQRVQDYRQWREATKDSPKMCYARVLEGLKPPPTMFEIVHDPNAYEAGYSDAFYDGLYLPDQLSCGCDKCRKKYDDGQAQAIRDIVGAK